MGRLKAFRVDISTDGLVLTSHKLHPSNVPVVDRLVDVARPAFSQP